MINKLKSLWSCIDGLSSGTKTIVIIILIALIIPRYIDTRIISFGESFNREAEYRKLQSENYTMKVAPLINKEIRGILNSDGDIQNVILINYHNTKTSIAGFSYLYLSALTEEARDREWKHEWKDLDYIYYSDELARIHNRKFLRVDSLSQMKTDFPKLKRKLESCNIQTAAFYPLDGIFSHIGMIVVYYNKQKKYNLGYFQTNLAPYIQRLSSLLDYNNITSELQK